MVQYCPLHRIGYNPDLDPTCPQCMIARVQPPEQLEVDDNPASAGYGFPKKAGEAEGSREFRRVSGR